MTRSDTNIDILMAESGIRTDKDMAEKLGMTPQRLSYRLRGSIKIDTLSIFANYFNTTIKKLLKDKI
tara:strand:- start:15667 stop:15867 length:201 start_codon:yes stop_codon:yes gene_type:complete